MNYVDRVTSKGTVYEISDSEAREVKLDKKDLPTNLSQFKNDIGAIDKTVANLENYYLKSETYTQDEIKDLLSNRLRYLVVTELPTGNFDRNVIYLIQRKAGEESEQDFYDEYLYIGGDWELIGNTFVDLSDYYRKAEIESVVDEKISVETANRENADELLNEKIQALRAALDELGENLNAETARAEEAELTNRTRAETALENIDIEKERAESAEMALSERVAVAESHIVDTSNPHNVTKEQLGLENVVNVGIDTTPMAYSENAVTSGGVFNALLTKVDKIDGKALSDENFSYAEKVKLSGLENYDDTELRSRIDENKAAIDTLNADSDTEGSVDAKIKAAVESITQFDFKIVDALPDIADAKKGVIYLVPSKNTSHTPPTADFAQNQAGNSESDTGNTNSDIPESSSEQGNEEGNTENANSEIPESSSDIPETNSDVDLSDYYKKSEVNAVIDDKISEEATARKNADTLLDSKIESLRSEFDEKVSGGGFSDLENESYSEYIFIGDKFEHLGEKTVEMELSEYAKKNEVTALVSVKNDKITVEDDTSVLTDSDSFDETSAGTNPTTTKRRLLSTLWTYIRRKISDALGGADLGEVIAQNTSDISDLQGDKQNKTFETPLTIGGVNRTTVEGALKGLNDLVPSDASASNKLVTASDIVDLDAYQKKELTSGALIEDVIPADASASNKLMTENRIDNLRVFSFYITEEKQRIISFPSNGGVIGIHLNVTGWNGASNGHADITCYNEVSNGRLRGTYYGMSNTYIGDTSYGIVIGNRNSNRIQVNLLIQSDVVPTIGEEEANTLSAHSQWMSKLVTESGMNTYAKPHIYTLSAAGYPTLQALFDELVARLKADAVGNNYGICFMGTWTGKSFFEGSFFTIDRRSTYFKVTFQNPQDSKTLYTGYTGYSDVQATYTGVV